MMSYDNDNFCILVQARMIVTYNNIPRAKFNFYLHRQSKNIEFPFQLLAICIASV